MQGDDTLTILRLACAPHPPGSQARPSSLEGGPTRGESRIPITDEPGGLQIADYGARDRRVPCLRADTYRPAVDALVLYVGLVAGQRHHEHQEQDKRAKGQSY